MERDTTDYYLVVLDERLMRDIVYDLDPYNPSLHFWIGTKLFSRAEDKESTIDKKNMSFSDFETVEDIFPEMRLLGLSNFWWILANEGVGKTQFINPKKCKITPQMIQKGLKRRALKKTKLPVRTVPQDILERVGLN